MNVLLVGAGKMGLPMAKHLLTAGYQIAAFDQSPAAQNEISSSGITLAKDLLESLRVADVIISSLPHDQAYISVGETIALNSKRGAIYVDTSTVSLGASQKIAAMCEQSGISHIRATLSGNNKMAEQAQLTVMVSGPAKAYEIVRPMLEKFGPTLFYLGGEDQARLMKLVINLMIAMTSGMLSEALALGEKGGLDWGQMWEVISASAVGSPIIKAKSAQLSKRDYTPTFTVLQMQKDVGLILDAGSELKVPLALSAIVSQLLKAAEAQGDSSLDYAAIIRSVERSAGIVVK